MSNNSIWSPVDRDVFRARVELDVTVVCDSLSAEEKESERLEVTVRLWRLETPSNKALLDVVSPAGSRRARLGNTDAVLLHYTTGDKWQTIPALPASLTSNNTGPIHNEPSQDRETQSSLGEKSKK
ncbi:hypothetical protein SRHO_G00275820 [Serrasalmus rhombeus]